MVNQDVNEQNDAKFYYLTEKGNVVGSFTEMKGLKPATHEDFEAQNAKVTEAFEKAKNAPEQVAKRQSLLFGQVVTELSTGSAALATARSRVSYPNMRKAALEVIEASEFKGSVADLTAKTLELLKIE